MRTMTALISRNRKLFFRDRGMFLSSLITPVILIVLYATFLANVYKDSFLSALPDTVQISDKLINGTVAAQLAAALLLLGQRPVPHCGVSQKRNGALGNKKTTCYAGGGSCFSLQY